MLLLLILFCFVCGAFGDINQVTGNGELAQFEYAKKAVLRSKDFAVSVVNPLQNCAVALSVCRVQSPLLIKFEKMINQYASSKIAALAIGYPPDCRMVSKCINEFIQDFAQTYGDEPSLVYLSNKVSELMTSGMYKSGDSQLTRPLAVSCLLHQFDSSSGRTQLYQVDSSGSVSDRLYSIIGDFTSVTFKSVESIVQQIQKNTMDEQSRISDGLVQLIDTICESVGEDDQLYNVEMCVVSEEGVKNWSGSAVDKNYFKSSEAALSLKNLLPNAKLEAK